MGTEVGPRGPIWMAVWVQAVPCDITDRGRIGTPLDEQRVITLQARRKPTSLENGYFSYFQGEIAFAFACTFAWYERILSGLKIGISRGSVFSRADSVFLSLYFVILILTNFYFQNTKRINRYYPRSTTKLQVRRKLDQRDLVFFLINTISDQIGLRIELD